MHKLVSCIMYNYCHTALSYYFIGVIYYYRILYEMVCLVCQSTIAFHVVLLFAVVIGQAASQCDTTQTVVYLKFAVNSSSPSLLVKPPVLNDIDNSCEEVDLACCSSSDGTEYLLESLDDAFGMIESRIEENKTSDSGFLVALLSDTEYQLQESHHLNKLTTFILQSVDTSFSVFCNENASLSFGDICSVTFHAISLHQCGSTFKNAPSIRLSNLLVQDSASSGVDIMFSHTPSHCSVYESKIYMISDSMFVNNGHITTSKVATHGGGLNIETLFQSMNVTITGTKFIGNVATIGAGLSYSAYNNRSSICVLDCEFINNSATEHGGAANIVGTNACFQNTNITDNTAIYTAGGVYQFIPTQDAKIKITYDGCNFMNNSGEGSASLLVAASVDSFLEVESEYQSLKIRNSAFINNVASKKLFFGQTPCIIHSENVYLSFQDTVLLNNSATALCVQSSGIILSGRVEFMYNSGYLGGAVNTIRSLIDVESNSSILFLGNRASYGGAIYEDGLIFGTETCLFDFDEDDTNFNITFLNNKALSRGHSIYFFEVNDECLRDIEHPGVMLAENQATSDATSIIFHTPVYTINNTDFIDLILGQFIVFNVTVQDFFHSSSFALVNIQLLNKEDVQDQGDEPISHRLNGFQHLSIENGLNRPSLSIAGPLVNTSQSQYVLQVSGSDSMGTIHVLLKPCPLGFEYNEMSQQCLCVNDDAIACDFSSGTSCIKKEFWIGVFGNSSSAVAPCASLYCQNNNGNCSECPIVDHVGYCLLPQLSAEQCLFNRHGFLCAECKEDFALTFGGVKCVDNSTCKKGKGSIPAILNVVFVIFTIALLIAAIKLDYRLSSGYVFCFIYYFSIIRHLLNPVIVGNSMLLFISIMTSVTQLNPQFLGYMSICFSTNFTVLQLQAFLYFNPIAISIFVLLVITISRLFSKHVKFGDNTIVKAISLLLLLSFTALIETSFNILNPVQFNEIPGLYVNVEPSTKYLDISKHVPWFLMAVVTVFLLVIPFTLLLVFAPVLTKCFNLNKIKPFLDEFQSCYKDKFRWMAGYYFVARFIYLVILTSPRYSPVVSQYIIQLLSFAILVIHMLLQPYENKWMNFADSILLADIVLVTLLFGNTANSVFETIPKLRVTIVYILVLIPVVYLIVVIVITIQNPWFSLNDLKNRFKKKEDEETDTITYSSIDGPRRSLSISIGLREPLLDIADDKESIFRSISPSNARDKRKRVSHSIVGSPRDDSMELEREVLEENLNGKEGIKHRSASVTSQAWLISSEDESLENKLL